jgi:diaminopimelate epimerase
MTFHFYKYQGTGNDFIIADNRNGSYNHLNKEQVRHLCDRRFGIGADGLMLLNAHADMDFEMKYFNADGRESTMCGNGGRCLVMFARKMGIKKETVHFNAIDGPHEATVDDNGWVNLKMQAVTSVSHHGQHAILNTGSPHYVQFTADVMNLDVYQKGKAIRYSKEFEKEGINVNFVETLDEDSIYVRTYERGVEDETLSCGTGVTAAALVCAHNDRGFNAINIRTPGGRLRVEFDRLDDNHFDNIWLCGPATFVFSGEVEIPE